MGSVGAAAQQIHLGFKTQAPISAVAWHSLSQHRAEEVGSVLRGGVGGGGKAVQLVFPDSVLILNRKNECYTRMQGKATFALCSKTH